MKYLLMILAVVMIFAAPALAFDGNVSHDALAKMGLSGMTAMSDAQGAAIRGLGYQKTSVSVFGNAKSSIFGVQTSNAGYDATGKTFATGNGQSTTSITQYEANSYGWLVPVCKTVVSATVCSSAFAK